MEETDQNYEISLEYTCRTCLKNDLENLMIPVFDNYDNSGITPFEIIEEFVFMKLKICKDDGLPQNICADCMERLVLVNSFRIECEKSHEFLDKYVQRSTLKTTDEQLEAAKHDDYKNFEFLSMQGNEFQSGRMIIIEKEIMSKSNLQEIIQNDNQIEHFEETDSFHVEIEEEFLEELGELECNICGKMYKRKPHLDRHMATHTEQDVTEMKVKKKFQPTSTNHYCYKCGKRFSKIKSLEEHEIRGKCVSSENPACRYCKETFTTIENLEVHLEKSHPKDRPHICPICKKSFQSVSNRNTHVQSHNKEGSFTCDICNQGFKSKVYLNKHRKSVHTIASHTCPHCLMTFDNTVKYDYHLKTHDPNKKYQCKFCDKSFMQHHHLANHERTHTGARPYLCNICGKDFKQESNFKLHLRIHDGVRPHVCTICSKDFVQRGSYVLHMRQHTGHRPFQCEHCGKDFIQKSTLNVHLRTHTGERPYKCNSCTKAFAQAQQLKYHNHSAHNGPALRKIKLPKIEAEEETAGDETNRTENRIVKEKIYPYVCHICNKGFKLPCSLSSHLKVHTEDRKHICTECGNTFKRAEHLRIHINGVHLKQKPYSCDICLKSFSQAGDRNIHMRRHTGERPHSCPQCNKSFRLLKAMRAHQRIHTGERPYHCEFCKMDFMTYTALATHTMKHKEHSQVPSQPQDHNHGGIKYEIVEIAQEPKIISIPNPIVIETLQQPDTIADKSRTHIVLTMP